MHMISVERVTSGDGIAIGDINVLLSQLRRTPGTWQGTEEDLQSTAADTHTIFVVARDEEKVVGMGMVFMTPRFGEKLGFVENIVVLDSYRGKGLGRKIMEVLIAESKKAGVTRLDLTSNSERVPANELYKKLGFVLKETNAYLLKL